MCEPRPDLLGRTIHAATRARFQRLLLFLGVELASAELARTLEWRDGPVVPRALQIRVTPRSAWRLPGRRRTVRRRSALRSGRLCLRLGRQNEPECCCEGYGNKARKPDPHECAPLVSANATSMPLALETPTGPTTNTLNRVSVRSDGTKGRRAKVRYGGPA